MQLCGARCSHTLGTSRATHVALVSSHLQEVVQLHYCNYLYYRLLYSLQVQRNLPLGFWSTPELATTIPVPMCLDLKQRDIKDRILMYPSHVTGCA